ncbi:MAG: hypothetical protein JXR31_11035 [Prolixibacteraceae bacterium]|nr:hypothetical protein [Prolixibacteraceae bacterium]MBN2774776.1 hypothetical protein [Prolixibacteraceae bacterium]
MKIIKSDKTGRNIHSPFIYRLIANVLFAPYPFYAFSEINLMAKEKNEQLNLQMLFRLVNHFQFDDVLIVGFTDKITEKVCILAKSDLNISVGDKITSEKQKPSEEKYSRLVIINDRKCFIPDIFPEVHEVWLWNNLNDKVTREDFRLIKTINEVQITIELNQLGIAIFNRNFEKQNYVIKH